MKVYCVSISYNYKDMYSEYHSHTPVELYSTFEKAVKFGASNSIEILKDFGVKSTIDDFDWTSTEFGGEWTFSRKYITGYADIICTIYEQEVL